MLYVGTDQELIAAVSRALGESRSLIRNRGFQMIEIVVLGSDETLPDGETISTSETATDADTVDLAEVAGLDWDRYDDSRLHRRPRGRRRRRVA